MSSRILLLVLALFVSSAVMADATIPTRDEPGSKDLSFLKRYEGSFIVNYEHKSFDEASFPLSPIKMVADKEKRDSRNNHIFEPDKKTDVEGAYTRLLYVLPAERSPLEVIRNYQDEIEAANGKVLYSCKNTDCGGDMEGNDTGGGYEGIFEKVYPTSGSRRRIIPMGTVPARWISKNNVTWSPHFRSPEVTRRWRS